MPHRRPRLAGLLAGLLVAAAAAFTAVSLPPRQAAVVTGQWRPTLPATRLRGAYHVHTTRSDGTGTVGEVARAAARARLDFLILTDHGDASRTFDLPTYVDNVLVIDAVEVSTRLGHLAAIGLAGPAPYRLAGWPDDVAEDVRWLGGVGFAAHPDSPRDSLSWRDWDAQVHGFEWLNADSEWRDESRWGLARALAAYPWRPVEAIVSTFDRPAPALTRWDGFSREGRFLIALAGADAHARIGFRDYEDDGEAGGWALRGARLRADVPRLLDHRRTRHAARPAARRGRGAAGPVHRSGAFLHRDRRTGVARAAGVLRDAPGGIARMGDRLPAGTDVTFTVRTLAPAGAEIRLLRNGEAVATSTGLELTWRHRADLKPGERGAAFRVEVAWPPGMASRVPWILTNPIFVEPAPPVPRGEAGVDDRPGAGEPAWGREVAGIDLRSCAVEKDQVSSAAVTADESGDDLV